MKTALSILITTVLYTFSVSAMSHEGHEHIHLSHYSFYFLLLCSLLAVSPVFYKRFQNNNKPEHTL